MKPKALIFFAIVLVANKQPIQEDNGVLFFEGRPKVGCSFNRVLPSDDGQNFVVSEQSDRFQDRRDFEAPNSFVVFSNFRVDRGNTESVDRVFTVGSRDYRLRPLYWSTDGLYFRSGATALLRGRVTETWEVDPELLNTAWQHFELTINSLEGLRALQAPESIRSALSFSSNNGLRRQAAYLGRETVFSAIDAQNKQALLVGRRASSMKPLGLGAFFQRFNILTSTNGQKYTFIGYEGNVSGFQMDSQYSLPVLDISSGRQVGVFRPDKIEIGQVRLAVETFADDGYLLKDVGFADGHIFALAENGENYSVFLIANLDPRQSQKIEICKLDERLLFGEGADRNPTSKSGADIPNRRGTYPIIGVPLSSDSGTTGILHRSMGSKTRGVIIYFHGGPARMSDPYHVPKALERLFHLGYDILSVEYAGSVGGGLDLSESLSNRASFGFFENANAIRQWLQTESYDEVHTYSVSYGTLPAMVFTNNFRSLTAKRVFVAPLLNHPELELLETPNSILSVESGSQIEFEKGLYGSAAAREAYVRWVAENSASYRASNDDLFVFGEYDRLTPIESAPASILSDGKILVVKRGHDFIVADDQTIKTIFDHISEHN